MQNNSVVGNILSGASLIAVTGIVVFMIRSCDATERKNMSLLMFLTAYSVIFWALFEQAGSSLNLFADRNVDKEVLGFSMTASQTQSFNAAFIILLAPLFAALWQWLAKRGSEPSTAAKFGLGITQAGLGFLVLVYGIGQADGDGQAALIWLALAYLIHTTGELCLSPVGLSMVTRLAVTRVVGLMMGVWFLSSSVAHYVAGIIAGLASVDGGADAASVDSLVVYEQTFLQLGLIGVGTGGLLLVLAPLLTRWLQKVEAELE